MRDSLFGHLVAKFASHPENLATDALCYVLGRYPAAATALMEFVQLTGFEKDLQSTISFETQCIGSEGSIPDVVGIDSGGRKRVIIEAKFWAGLTEHQPVTYLAQLPSEAEGMVLFVAPKVRVTTLWPELVRRCKEAALPISDHTSEFGEMSYREIGERHILALTSWRAVLATVLNAVEAEGNQTAAADVRQIQGLCERMDSEAFLPLRAEEMSELIGRRTVQYCQLVIEVAAKAAAEGLGSWKNPGGSISTASYGRYVILENHGCFLQFNPDLWSRRRCTPLWLSIKSIDWKAAPRETASALASLEAEDPPRVIREGAELLIPLQIPLGMEQDRVVSALMRQIRGIAALLRKVNFVKSAAKS